jgi:hypothetical protein
MLSEHEKCMRLKVEFVNCKKTPAFAAKFAADAGVFNCRPVV